MKIIDITYHLKKSNFFLMMVKDGNVSDRWDKRFVRSHHVVHEMAGSNINFEHPRTLPYMHTN